MSVSRGCHKSIHFVINIILMKNMNIYCKTDRRHPEKDIHRERHPETDIHRETPRDRHTQRETDTERDTQRETDRHTVSTVTTSIVCK